MCLGFWLFFSVVVHMLCSLRMVFSAELFQPLVTTVFNIFLM